MQWVGVVTTSPLGCHYFVWDKTVMKVMVGTSTFSAFVTTDLSDFK